MHYNIFSESTSDLSQATHLRQRRFTCDVLSFQSKLITPNHSACALRCLSLKRTGGKCQRGICICRGKKWGK